MKVGALIKILSRFDQEKEIKLIISDPCTGCERAEDIERVGHYKELKDPPNGLIDKQEKDCYLLGGG